MGFVTCEHNEVLIVSGCCYNQSRFVTSGQVFVCTCIQEVQRLPAGILSLSIVNLKAHSNDGIQVSVIADAKVQVETSIQEMLRLAAENFLGKSEEEIGNILRESIQGHQRAAISAMSIKDIYTDRRKFSTAVFEKASTDLIHMGFRMVSYTMENVLDVEGDLANKFKSQDRK